MYQALSYFLLSWLVDMLVRLEKVSDVQRLTSPEVSMDRPVQTELQCASVKGPVPVSARNLLTAQDSQDGGFARHRDEVGPALCARTSIESLDNVCCRCDRASLVEGTMCEDLTSCG